MENNINMQKAKLVATNLKALRISHGLSQQQLSQAVNISQQNISRWELGIHIPNIIDCITIADYYHISLDELADRDLN